VIGLTLTGCTTSQSTGFPPPSGYSSWEEYNQQQVSQTTTTEASTITTTTTITTTSSTTQMEVHTEFHFDLLPIFLWLLGIVLYFLPTIIALARHHINSLAIFVVNFLTGWSFIGWVIALVWSVKRKE
ncbi:MAG: superinfection immunity protein, partial [Dehalococcoidales bacterium]|nr:superinfection immunity protein [Dehalococcoidales bacterium]